MQTLFQFGFEGGNEGVGTPGASGLGIKLELGEKLGVDFLIEDIEPAIFKFFG